MEWTVIAYWENWLCPSLDRSTWTKFDPESWKESTLAAVAVGYDWHHGYAPFSVEVVLKGKLLYGRYYIFANLDDANKFYTEKAASQQLSAEDLYGVQPGDAVQIKEVSMHINGELVNLSLFPSPMDEGQQRKRTARQNYNVQTTKEPDSCEVAEQQRSDSWEAYLKERGITQKEYEAETLKEESIGFRQGDLYEKLPVLREEYKELSNEEVVEIMVCYMNNLRYQ